ncbi:MAG TPA: CHRD domain-containing protein [Rhizomicrobium sp.]|nr:CHRD domain-containing protein [Rhizomicrobium sp.]
MRNGYLAPVFVSLVLGTVSAARAETVSLVAHLLGSTMVPITQSDAFAEGQFTYDSTTRALQYYVNYDGVAPAKVDLHGPAAAGEKAASAVDIPLSESPISGTVNLTAEQGAQLLAGKMYLDIHSQKYPDGEIRGQIVKQ